MSTKKSVSGSQHSGGTSTTSSTTTDKSLPLNHSNLSLVGREDEMNQLQQALDRVCQPNAVSEILLVSGESGSGKSTLVQTLGSSVDESMRGFFCAGKYGQFQDSRPCGALVDAVTELCFAIQTSNMLEQVQRNVKQDLARDTSPLIKLIPTIQLVVQDASDLQQECSSISHEFSNQRFIYLFRLFLNAVCKVHPVVLFLDDVQWVDEASRGLLDSLARDAQSRNLLLLCAMRNDKESMSFNLPSNTELSNSRIEVCPLLEENVNEIVASLLECPPLHTTDLGNLVTLKTNGNAFFVIEYVEMLHREGLIMFNFGTNKWEWDLDKIATRTDVSDNVAKLLVDKISILPRQVQIVLMVAACLGFSFDKQSLEEVVLSADLIQGNSACESSTLAEEKINQQDETESKRIFQKALTVAVKAGLLEESMGNGRIKFSHDGVQQSAFRMIPENVSDSQSLRSKVGSVVLEMSRSEGSEEWMLFVSVDLLTRYSSFPTSDSKKDLAELCLLAAQKAADKSAFISAAQFADRGLDLLPQEHWDTCYDLFLKLRTLSAKTHYSYGDFETTEEQISIITNRAKSMDDMLEARLVRVAILGSRTDYKGAITEGSDILRWMGVRVPKRASTFHVMRAVKKVKRLLKGRKPMDLLRLPTKTNDTVNGAMRILNDLVIYDWRGGEGSCLVLHLLLMMQLTLKHGVGSYGTCAICLYGGLLSHAGDLHEAYEYGIVAEKLMERPETREGRASTLKMAHLCLWHLKKPIYSSLPVALEAYQAAKEIGDVVMAAYCLQMHGMLGVMVGVPLENLEEEMRGYCDFCREFRQEACLFELLPFYQLSMNLRGMTKDPLVLTGSGMDEERFVQSFAHSNDGMSQLLLLAYARTMLLFLFDELELAEVERKKVSPRNDFISTYFARMNNFFWCGLTCLGLARQTGRRKHIRHAKPYIKQLKRLASFGSVNCVHMLKLLLAEERALTDRSGAVVREYDSAISMAGRSGFRLVKAVALERAGVYMMDCGDESMAADYLGRACVEFEEYGAEAKLMHMKSRYPSVRFAIGKVGPQKVSQQLQCHVVEQWNQKV